MKILFWSLLMSSASLAAQNGGVTNALKTELKKGIFSATVQAGFHFNDKAPNLLKADNAQIKPTMLSRQNISFKLPKDYKTAEAALYICDDAESFCEPRHIPIKGGETATTNSTALDEAKQLAAKEKKLILVDFSARWCPGCVRLEQEVFSNPDFKNESKNFIKVNLDVDRFETAAAKKKYSVTGIPTLLILNSDLNEVSRVVDYQPPSAVVSFLRLAEKTPLTFEELKLKADADDNAAALLLGERQYNAGQYQDAVTYLGKVNPEPVELLDARVQAAVKEAEQDESKKLVAQKVIKNILAQENTTTRSINWRTALANLLPKEDEERKKIAREGLALADTILADDKKLQLALKGDQVGEFSGLEKFMIAFERADLADAGNLEESEVQAANTKVVEVGKQLKIPISRVGPSMRYLIALVGAKDWPEAEHQAKRLLEKDPKNPEFQRRLLRILVETHKFSQAVEVGKQALHGSYGRNEVWVVQQLAKAYAGSKQTLEAKALIKSYLERTDIDWSGLKKEKEDLEGQLKKLSV